MGRPASLGILEEVRRVVKFFGADEAGRTANETCSRVPGTAEWFAHSLGHNKNAAVTLTL